MYNRYYKFIKMGDHDLIVLLTAAASAFGLKEIWAVIKKRMDIDARKSENKSAIKASYETTKDQITATVIEELKDKIGELEAKIDELIKENMALNVKLARMEERILVNAKTKAKRKRNNIKEK
jgi:predicted RNase H-like nuclease (RuvC/YqgF family)